MSAGDISLRYMLFGDDISASRAIKKVGAEAESTGHKIGAGVTKAGRDIGIAVLAAGAASLKLGADFQEATTLLVTGAGESEKNLELVKDGLLAMAPAVGMGPVALAKAMFLVESAGFHGATGLTVMKAAAEGAKIGGAEATVVADGLTTALIDYHLPASQAAHVTSQLVATVAAGKTTMGDLSGALAHVLPFAAGLKVSFNQVMGAMATMTGEGIKADDAATYLRFTMMSLANETPKGAKALKLVGLSTQQLTDDLKNKGLSGTLAEITAAIGKKFPKGGAEATKALAAIVGGTRGMSATLALTGSHMGTFVKNIHSVAGASTEAGGHVKGWAETQKDLRTQLSMVGAGIQAMGVKIGTVLIPFVLKAIQVGKAWTDWLVAHKPVLYGIVAAMGALVVASIALRVATLAQAAATMVFTAATSAAIAEVGLLNATLDANVFAIVVLAIIALVAGLVYAYKHFQTFRNIVDGALKAVGAGAKWLWEKAIKPAFAAIVVGVKALGAAGLWLWNNAIKPAFTFIGAAIKFLWNNVVKPVFAVMKVAFMVWATLVMAVWLLFVKPAFTFIGGIVKWLWNNVMKPQFALMGAGLKILGGVVMWLWNNVMKPQFALMGAALKVFGGVVKWLWANIMRPTLLLIGNAFLSTIGGMLHAVANIATALHLPFANALQKAANSVDGFGRKVLKTINGLPANKTITVGVRFTAGGYKTSLSPLTAAGRAATPIFKKEGGLVPWMRGARKGVDSVHALLVPDEFVVREDGSNLDEAHAHFARKGKIRRYANGGLVTLRANVPSARAIGSAVNAGFGRAVSHANLQGLLNQVMATMAGGGGGSLPGGGMAGGGNARANQLIAARLLPLFGWAANQLPPLISLWNGESGWNQNAYNASSGATGIPQSLPGNKMASAGADWRTNPVTQERWGMGYIKGRYGSPANAFATWSGRSPHWYDQGGYLPTGLSLAYNGTGKPERIPNPNESQRQGGDIHVHVHGALDPNAVARQVQAMLLRLKRTNGVALGLA